MSIFFFIVFVLLAAILQTSTGFGFSIMATPFLLLIFEPKEAIQINLILSLLISLALINKIKKDVDVAVLKRFIISSIPGLFIGILIFTKVNATALKIGLGTIILILTILLICKVRLARSRRRDYLVGDYRVRLQQELACRDRLYYCISQVQIQKKKSYAQRR